MNFTSRTRLNTKIAAPMRPAMITCAGFSCVTSDSCSARLLMPRNDQNTAFATWRGEAALRSGSPFITLSAAVPRSVHFEKGIGQRDRVDFVRQLRIDHEDDGHLSNFARAERLLLKAEAVHLPEVERRLLRAVARNGLSRHGPLERVPDLVHDLRHLARMHRYARLERLESPSQALRVGVEFDRDIARGVHLSVLRRHSVRLKYVSDARHFADLLVERNEGEAEAEHYGHHHQQFLHQLPVGVRTGVISPPVARGSCDRERGSADASIRACRRLPRAAGRPFRLARAP